MKDEPPDLTAWIHEALHVGPSAIHGQGLFTSSQLPAMTIAIRFGGFLFSADLRYNYDSLARSSIVGLSDDVLLAEKHAEARDPSDFLNHSCTPNLGMLDAITLVAITDIKAGDELTVDYGYWEVDETYVMKNPCNCTGTACRGDVTGRDWRLGLQHLKMWSAPFIRRRMP